MAANIKITDIKEELFDVVVKEEVFEYGQNITVKEEVVDHGIEPVVKEEIFNYGQNNIGKEDLIYNDFDFIVKEESFYYGEENYDENTLINFNVIKHEEDDHIPINVFEPRQQSTTIHPSPQVKSCVCTQNNLHQLIPAPRKYNKRTHWGIHPMQRRSQTQEENRMLHVIKPIE